MGKAVAISRVLGRGAGGHCQPPPFGSKLLVRLMPSDSALVELFRPFRTVSGVLPAPFAACEVSARSPGRPLGFLWRGPLTKESSGVRRCVNGVFS